MRADGTQRVAADVSIGGKAGWILWIALATLGLGLLGLGLAGALMWAGLHNLGSGPGSPATAGAPAAVMPGAAGATTHAQAQATTGGYPVRFEARLDAPLSP